MRQRAEQFPLSVREDAGSRVRAKGAESVAVELAEKWPANIGQAACDKASPAIAVMLHLRSCYVSKAAILTVPAHPVPVENRSPA
jgi:hypothetical protein